MVKEEVMYNANALIGVWMNGVDEDKLSDLRLVFEGENRSLIVRCNNVSDAAEKLGNMLYEGNKLYSCCKLLGHVDKLNKEFGSIDIV